MNEENKVTNEDLEITSNTEVAKTETEVAQGIKPEEKTVVYASIDDLQKIEVKIGTIVSVEEIEGTDKLLKLKVNFGEFEERQILSGIKKHFPDPKTLEGIQTTFITNLKPRMMMGLESNGMLYAGGFSGELILLTPHIPCTPGAPLH